MIRKLTLSSGVAALAMAAAIIGPTATASNTAADADRTHATTTAATASEGHATTAVDLEGHPVTAADLAPAQQGDTTAPLLGWDVPWAMSYQLDASCSPYADAIRQGAAAWNQLTEGGGTPVECRSDYITDCGGGSNVVGCNWGQGQRIALFPGGVNDDALLAAHEFGHDWYGHSSYQCAGWGTPEEVMAPTICNLSVGAVPQGQM